MMDELLSTASTSQSGNNLESSQNSSADSSSNLDESAPLINPADDASRKRKAESGISEADTSADSSESTSASLPKVSRRIPHNPENPPFDWQSSKESLKDRTAYVFDHELFCDVTFLVGQGLLAKRIRAHKFVLSISSAVFEAMFSGEWFSAAEDIVVPDVEVAAFSALLRFLYTDEVSLCADTVMAILYASKKYGVPSLSKKCLDFLLHRLCPDNAFLLLSQARLFDEKDFAKACFKKIYSHAVQAFSSDCFTDINVETLCKVVERHDLRIREIQLFEAVCRWSKAEMARENLADNLENQRSVLKKVLPLLRFPLMSLEEVSATVAPSGLLPSRQLVSLYRYLTMSPKPPILFNTTPRGKKKTVSINRFQENNAPGAIWQYFDTYTDAIGFCTDHDIWMMGFGLYGPLDRSGEYGIAMALVNTVTGIISYEESRTHELVRSEACHKFRFSIGVKIAAYTNYTLKFNISGPATRCGTGGFKDITYDTQYGGQVTFTFNSVSDPNDPLLRSYVWQGQIPEILFRFF